MQSQEKIDLLRMLGADVRPVAAVAYENPANYNHQAKEFAEATPGAVWTNQFDNVANARAHYETTGPEIWRQTGGKVSIASSTTRRIQLINLPWTGGCIHLRHWDRGHSLWRCALLQRSARERREKGGVVACRPSWQRAAQLRDQRRKAQRKRRGLNY
jgi:hypothetical protein